MEEASKKDRTAMMIYHSNQRRDNAVRWNKPITEVIVKIIVEALEIIKEALKNTSMKGRKNK